MLLFYAIFLPVGRCFSIDARKNTKESLSACGGASTWFSPAGVAYTLQIIFIYVFAVGAKYNNFWLQERTSVYYALQLKHFTTSFAGVLGQYPELCKWITSATMFVELVGPLFLLSPFLNSFFRILVVFVFIGLHVGFDLCFHLGLFPLISITGWIALLPKYFWDIFSRLGKGQRVFSAAEAAPRPSDRSSLASAVFFTFLMSAVVVSNIHGLNRRKSGLTWRPELVKPIAEALPIKAVLYLTGMHQRWTMFARPAPTSGWFVVRGVLADDSELDVFQDNGVLVWEEPSNIPAMYKDQYWRNYFMKLLMDGQESSRKLFLEYFCRLDSHRNGDQDKSLRKVELYYLYRRLQPPYRTASKLEKTIIAAANCSAGLGPDKKLALFDGP